jgi:hypothetical protein
VDLKLIRHASESLGHWWATLPEVLDLELTEEPAEWRDIVALVAAECEGNDREIEEGGPGLSLPVGIWFREGLYPSWHRWKHVSLTGRVVIESDANKSVITIDRPDGPAIIYQRDRGGSESLVVTDLCLASHRSDWEHWFCASGPRGWIDVEPRSGWGLACERHDQIVEAIMRGDVDALLDFEHPEKARIIAEATRIASGIPVVRTYRMEEVSQ